jgi:hypothetical protein
VSISTTKSTSVVCQHANVNVVCDVETVEQRRPRVMSVANHHSLTPFMWAMTGDEQDVMGGVNLNHRADEPYV